MNVGGGALTIDGLAWQSSSEAGVTTNGYRVSKPTQVLTPSTTPERTSMITDGVYRSSSMSLSVPRIPNGSWDVWVTHFEDNNDVQYSLRLEGQTVVSAGRTGAAGSWQRQGPFRVQVADGRLDVGTSGGSFNLSGLELVPAG